MSITCKKKKLLTFTSPPEWVSGAALVTTLEVSQPTSSLAVLNCVGIQRILPFEKGKVYFFQKQQFTIGKNILYYEPVHTV